MRRWVFLFILLTSCARDAIDPLSLAPSTPYASWSPLKGNTLISSRYCRTVVPPAFDTSELSLAQLIDIGLQNNPSTRETWAQARAASSQYGQSLSGFYPAASVNTTYFRQKGTFISTTAPQPYFYTQGGPDLLISYTLFDFGQRTAAAMAAREALYYADFTHNQNIQTVMQTVMDDYYNYLYQMAVLRANEANLINAQSSLDAANEKFSLGIAALGDVAQARTQYLQSKINLTTQKQNVENAFAQLAVDIGLPANLTFKVQPMPEQIVADPMLESVDALVARAQEYRPDFLAAQADLRSKEASLVGAKRAVLPVFSTALETGHYWFQQGFEETFFHWSASISVSMPLFQGFYYKNGIREAEANVDLSKAELLQTELSIVQNVTTAHMGVKTAALNLIDSEEYLKAAELEFNIALTSYKAGTSTLLDVMSAQSSLADARSKKAGSQKDWFTSLAAIAYATGSLCTGPEDICESY
ncbi:MAG TPA: TolC family protein [Chlamydiales bacterium]|nr:TolC family protein [Chlamydiales bacterium]